jgi:hypothetical protein
MIITNAKYFQDLSGTNCSIGATIDGMDLAIPLDPENSHYAEILRQVANGDLTIADAD